MALHEAQEIPLHYLPAEITISKGQAPIMKETIEKEKFVSLEELETQYIKEVLKSTAGNKSKAARILGIHPTSLFRKLKKLK